MVTEIVMTEMKEMTTEDGVGEVEGIETSVSTPAGAGCGDDGDCYTRDGVRHFTVVIG